MSQSAFKKYLINTTSFGSGDIVTISIPVTTSAPGIGSANLTYNKVGKLYFNMRLTSVSGGFGSLPIAQYAGTDLNNTYTEIANLIGVTIDTKYEKASLYSNVGVVKGFYQSSGPYWNINTSGSSGYTIIDGFIST